MLSGHVYRLQMWAPVIGVIGGGVLLTPTTQDTIAHPNAIITANNRRLSRAGSSHSLNLQDALTLPTPTTQEWKRRGPNSSQQGLSNTENWMLATVARDQMLPTALPTPTTITSRQNSHSTDSSGRPLLQMAVEISLLPTPTTNDSKNASLPPSQAERDGLAGAMLRNDSIPTGAATYLNPSFVEEMMGFPVGWTA